MATTVQGYYPITGFLRTQGDPNGNVTEMFYDDFGNMIRKEFADDTFFTFTFDGMHRLAISTDAKDLSTSYEYDWLGRLDKRFTAAWTETLVYHELGGVESETHFEGDLTDSISRLFNARGMLTQETTNIAGAPIAMDDLITVMEYDLSGAMTKLTYPGGREIDITRDALSRPKQIKDGSKTLADYDYLGRSRVESRSHHNGTSVNYGYDYMGRINDTTHADSTAVFDQRIYTWDKVSNKTQRRILNPAGGTDLRQVDYTYDGLNRMDLSTLTVGVNAPVATDYTLDDSGNRSTVGADTYGSVSPLHEYTTAPSDLFGGGRDYDLNGNWEGGGNGNSKLIMTYDADNLMTSYDNGVTDVEQAYHYDTANRRTWVDTNNDGTPDVYYLYLGDRILETYDNTGALMTSFVYGNYVDELIQRQDAPGYGGAEYYFHQNDQWNVVALTDGAGVVQQRYLYDDFGTPTVTLADWSLQAIGTALTTRLFQGREYDIDTEFYYYRARYYEPATGRFTSRDPLGIWGDILHLGNGYTFLNSNPWSLIDPFGLAAGGNISKIYDVRWKETQGAWIYNEISMDDLAILDRSEIAVNGMLNDLPKAAGLMSDHFTTATGDLDEYSKKQWDKQFILFHNPTDKAFKDAWESIKEKYGPRDQLTREFITFQKEVQRLNTKQRKSSLILGHSQGSIIISQALEHALNNEGRNTLDTFTYRFHGAAANKWVTNRRIRRTGGKLAGGSNATAWSGHPGDAIHNWVGHNTLNPVKLGYSLIAWPFLTGKGGMSPHTRAWEGDWGLPNSRDYPGQKGNPEGVASGGL